MGISILAPSRGSAIPLPTRDKRVNPSVESVPQASAWDAQYVLSKLEVVLSAKGLRRHH
jgi:hypothetical protein